ncbi:hypothetical protein EYF80_044111 [Liparis tanakae]|uniref:Uncharacterized protein n=1 Tax=Liparis tanakae TaxID=230148 RepID=A0A4Z2FZA1_9TELE|nr:hypothetical protein EYF80_044111 [Liparis tanakae]
MGSRIWNDVIIDESAEKTLTKENTVHLVYSWENTGYLSKQLHLLLDTVADQHVQHGVHHAVQAGQRQRAREPKVHLLLELAVAALLLHVVVAVEEDERAREQQHVVRGEADGEDADHAEGQQAHLPLGRGAQAGTLAHGGQHPPVAQRQHQQREQEADAHPRHVEPGDRLLHGVRLVAAVVRPVVGVEEVVVDQHHDVHRDHHGVDGGALGPGVAARAVGLGAQRVGDHQAAVHGDAAQQVDADVHVGVVEEAGHAAGNHAELPVVVAPVEEEDAQDVLPPHLLVNGAQGQHVEDQAEDEGQDVDRHQQVADGARADVDALGVSTLLITLGHAHPQGHEPVAQRVVTPEEVTQPSFIYYGQSQFIAQLRV